MKLLNTHFSLFPCYLIALQSKYSPQHSVLKHPQSMIFPQGKRPKFHIHIKQQVQIQFCMYLVASLCKQHTMKLYRGHGGKAQCFFKLGKRPILLHISIF
jgi:hypothetical protein